MRRFLQEARAASALNHPNILTIYESGHLDDVRFIAAAFIEGETLRERLRREHAQSPARFGSPLDTESCHTGCERILTAIDEFAPYALRRL